MGNKIPTRLAGFASGIVTLDKETMLAYNKGDQVDLKVIGPTILKILSDENYQPPLLPEVAISLTEMANRPNVSIKLVERTVRRDPTVATKVVSMANSAFHSRGRPIRSLNLAITRLGLATVRDIAFQVVAKATIFRVKGYADHMRSLFDQAQTAGVITREICRTLSFEPDLAYLCGLLHDMGEAIVLGILGENWPHKNVPLPAVDDLEGVLAALHCNAGARVCEKWEMPPLITDAIRHHHNPEKADQVSQMATVVAVGDILMTHAGIGKKALPIDPLSEPLFYRLNLTPDQVQKLLDFSVSIAQNPELATVMS